MGKIVKYCATCEESFAEKFAFCPNCGQAMTAFEMNPLVKEAQVSEAAKTDAILDDTATYAPMPIPIETASVTESVAPVSLPEIESSPAVETAAPVTLNETQLVSDEVKAEAIEESPVENTPVETKTFAAAAGATADNYQTTNLNYSAAPNAQAYQLNDGFNVTVIEEKNVKQRNTLLLGTMALMITLILGGTVYSLFQKELGVGAIEGGDLFAFVPVVEDVPMEVEEQPKKNDDDGGGGGGGGKEEPEPASKGRLVSQSEKPINPPDAKLPQLTNPELKIIQETQGTIKRPITAERAGLPGSDNLNPSNGTGRGGGIGSGTGTGIGSGLGTGEGSGTGSGSGSGNGNGNGGGTGNGSGGGNPPPPPPKAPVGVTEGVKIVSKPRPGYTDAARQNQVQGTVTLRVTFTANGSIGSISPVSGLPYGLTEQAIAAARGIRFEPAKKNGVAQTVTKQVQYSFSIY